jgi:hypothetical protein
MIETTVALGRILCEVLTISSQKLHDLLEESVFLQASPVLGRMKGCPTHCLHKFANFAAKITEYGPPGTWTAEDVASLGVIPAGNIFFVIFNREPSLTLNNQIVKEDVSNNKNSLLCSVV